MKIHWLCGVFLAAATISVQPVAAARMQYVRGYTTKSGHHVDGYYRSPRGTADTSGGHARSEAYAPVSTAQNGQDPGGQTQGGGSDGQCIPSTHPVVCREGTPWPVAYAPE